MGQAEFFANEVTFLTASLSLSKDINNKYCNQSQIGYSVVANFLALW